MHPPEELQSKRLLLRRYRREDAAAVHDAYATDPEVTRYLIWRPHECIEDTEAFLAGSRESWDKGLIFGWQLWCGNTIVGGFAFRPESPTRASIGFVLSRSHWGRGLVPEAIELVKDWAFEQAGYRRLWAVCDVDNSASARAMEKAGMRHEGTLGRWIVHPNVSEEPRDCLSFAITR